ncbi:MAG: non-oxidative hydroxyarylic acid decarboxylases subunit D [Chloroflexota bacterium]
MESLTCARCESGNIEKIVDSPLKGKWEVYMCGDCNFTWRSTEDLKNIPRNIDYLRENVMVLYPRQA